MRKVLGVILVIILVFPLLLASMVVFTVVNWGLDRDLYIETLTSEVLYEQLYSEDLILDLMRQRDQQLPNQNPAQFVSALRVLLPPEYLDSQVTQIINNAFDFLERETDELKLEIELQDLKDELTGPNQDIVLLNLAGALPECQEDFEISSEGLNLCKPAAMPAEVFVEDVLKPNLPTLIAFIPDAIELNDPISMNRLLREVPQPWRSYIDTMTLDTVTYLLLALAGFFWLLTALIAGKNWGERLKWLGWTLVIPAVLVLLIGVLGQPRVAWNWFSEMRSTPFQHLPATAVYTIEDIATQVLSGLRTGFITVGGIAVALSIGLIAWGAATRPEYE